MPSSHSGAFAPVDRCAPSAPKACSSNACPPRLAVSPRVAPRPLRLTALAVIGFASLTACDRTTEVAWLDPGADAGFDAGLDAGTDAGPDAGCLHPCGAECCSATQTCLDGHCSDCTPQDDETFCSNHHRACGSFTATDNCGSSRTVESCGSCPSGQHCVDATGTCEVDCTPEAPTAFCQRLGARCGSVTAEDDACKTMRTVDCGGCGLYEECDFVNRCQSICETDAALCGRLDRACGPAGGIDNCNQSRQVANCGDCPTSKFCNASGTCESCPIESDTAFCARMGKNCGSVSGSDNCGNPRTVVSCGACTPPETCGLNQICAPAGHPSNDNCSNPELLTFDASGHAHTQGSTAQAVNDDQPDFSFRCLGGGSDLVYTFTLNRAQNVDVILSPNFPTGAVPNVAVRTDCTLRFTEINCAQVEPTSPGGLYLRNQHSGTYFVWVDAARYSDFGPFQLDLQLSDPQPPPPNDTCAAPELLTFDSSGVARASGSTLDATDDFHGSCAPGSGPDVVYAFTLFDEASVSAKLTRKATARTYKPAIYLRATCTVGSDGDDRACNGTLTAAVAYGSVGRLPAGTYYLIVDGLDDSSGLFDLEVVQGPPIDNDSCNAPQSPLALTFDASGLALAQGETSLALNDTTNGCNGGQGNDLVYQFTLAEMKDVRVEVTPDAGSAYRPSVSIRTLCDQLSTELACTLASAAGAPVRLTSSHLDAGTYYVWVDGPASSQGRFTLQINADDPPAPPQNDQCAGALPLTFNPTTSVATVAATTLNATDGTSGSCQTASSPLDGNDVYYSFTLTTPRVVRAKVTRDAMDGGYRPAVSLRSDCSSFASPSELACVAAASTSVASVETPQFYLTAGTYYVVVDGAAATRGGFTLEVTAAGPPANDTCLNPEDLVFNNGVATTSGDTTFAFNDTTTTGCFTATFGNDLVYRFTLATLSSLQVVVAPTAGSQLGAYVSLRRSCADNATTVAGSCAFAVPGAATLLTMNKITAGTYYLWVDAQFSMGAFDLSVSSTPITAAPNDQCSGATLLTFDPVLGMAADTGDTRPAFNDYRGSCQATGDAGGDTVYTFQLRSPASLTATLTPLAGSSGFKPALYLRTNCTSAARSDERACVSTTSGTATTMTIPMLGAATYFLIVDGANDGAYSLLLVQGPPVANDNCTAPNSAQSLTFDATGTATVSGDTSIGNNDGEGSCHSNSMGKDVVYSFSLAEESAVVATVVPAPGSSLIPNLYVRTVCSSASSEVACRVATTSAPLVLSARLPAGTYYLWVDSFSSTAGAFDLSVVATAPLTVAGDQCADAIPISLGANGRAMVSGSTAGAANDYRGTCDTASMRSTGGDVVYALTLLADAKVSVTVARSTDLLPAVYIRDVCTNSSPSHELACVEAGVSATATNNWLPAGTYYIVVDGLAGGLDGPFMMLVVTGPPLKNDTCRGAEPLVFTAGVATFSGDTVGANPDSRATCNGHPATDLVYSFTLTSSQAVEITAQPTSGSQFRPDLFVRSICEAPPANDPNYTGELGCAKSDLPNTPATLRLPALRAGTYYLWVSTIYADPTWNGPFTGTVTLSAPPALPTNDTCAAAELITPDPVTGHATVTGTTVGAIDDSAGNCVDLGAGETYNGGDVVYYLTLDAPSSLVARVRGPAFKPSIYVRGDCANASTENACGVHLRIVGNTAANAYATASAPRLPAGTYYVIVDGMAQSTGDFTLDVQVGPLPDNDSCLAPSALSFDSSGVAEVSGDTSLATSTGDGSCTGALMRGSDLVYSFALTRAAAVQIALTTTIPAIYTPAIYLRATCDQPSTEFGCALESSNGSANLDFPLLGSGTYYVWVDTDTKWKTGPFTLRVTATPPVVAPPENDACVGAIDLTPTAPGMTTVLASESTATAAHDFSATCDNAIGPDLAYFITTTQAQKLVVTLTRNAATPSYVPVMYLRSTCGPSDAAGEVTCVKGAATATLTVNNLAAGTWYLIVDGSLGSSGRFDLQATLSPPVTNAPANESCFNPTPLVFTSNHATANGTTVGAQNEATGSCAIANGADVVYSFTTAYPGKITATVTPSPLSATYLPAVYLRQRCGSSNASDEAGCAKASSAGAAVSVSNSSAPAGTWFVWVDAASGVLVSPSAGDFTLSVDLTPTIGNDTCAAPTALSPGVPVAGSTASAIANYSGLLHLMRCGGAAVSGPDLVYVYTPSSDGPFTVSVVPNGWTPTVWMATASCGGLNDCLALGSPVGGATSLSFSNGVAGTPYYIVVTGFSSTDKGPFEITVQ